MASIKSQKGRLYVRGQFPHKDGSPGKAQYSLTLQLDDTPANRKRAAKQLAEIERQLKNGCFQWSDWVGATDARKGMTWQRAITRFHRKCVILGSVQESTWTVSYWGTLKLMPLSKQVTTKSIEEQLRRYDRKQFTYKKLHGFLKHIATIAEVPFPEVGCPLYNRKYVEIKDVPDDGEIIQWVQQAGEPYRWFFGMCATYGLRPHEVEACTQIDDGIVQVSDKTKTGFRTVIPLHAEWPALFRLDQPTVRPDSQRDPDRRDAVSQWLSNRRYVMGISWDNYSLRHAYAHRLWRAGGGELDIFTAARLMGHSVEEHVATYRSAIDPNQIARTAREAIERNLTKTRERLNQSMAQPHSR
tara:strand:- start:709 stop:1779 length:1071 start_codon:yes stop_codon:yes gene_type:complete